MNETTSALERRAALKAELDELDTECAVELLQQAQALHADIADIALHYHTINRENVWTILVADLTDLVKRSLDRPRPTSAIIEAVRLAGYAPHKSDSTLRNEVGNALRELLASGDIEQTTDPNGTVRKGMYQLHEASDAEPTQEGADV